MAALIPLDEHVLLRVGGLLRLQRRLAGEALVPLPKGWALTARLRRRLVLMVRALDGHMAQATYREIADALYGHGAVVRYSWKTSSIRGQTIRLAEQGSRGGDLLLEVELAPHPQFKIDGRDVTVSVPVAPWEAALGAKVSVPTLGGSVELTLPANTQGGKKLRLKGRGLPAATPGDQFVLIQIVTPPAKTDEQRAVYQEMAKQFADFSPRG